jgi:LysR family transcriptional regulator, glycine cleavage system transcriptional activator
MPMRLPPLASLRAFEAAVRLESVSRAADELYVTHGAVSHQIRALEEHVGTPLFTRQGRGVAPTHDGRTLAAAVRAAFEQIETATETVRRRAQSNRLSISSLPSFGARWLMPRIVRFMGKHPEWSIAIDSSPSLTDFARDGVDIAIRFGRGPWPGLEAEWLMDDEYILVASPTLKRGKLPTSPSQLADWPLLPADPEPWNAWCEAAGIDLARPAKGFAYEDMGVMLQGAIDGHGIMLARRAIAAAELEKGTLVELFGISTPSPSSYWLVWPTEPPLSERATAFREWLHAEVAPGRRKLRPSTLRGRRKRPNW